MGLTIVLVVTVLCVAVVAVFVLPRLLHSAQMVQASDNQAELPENKVLPEVVNLDYQPRFPKEEMVVFRVGRKDKYRAPEKDATTLGVVLPSGMVYRLSKTGVELVTSEYRGIPPDEVAGKLGLTIAEVVARR